MPRVSNRVLVQHVDGDRKWVLRSQLGQLAREWQRVPDDSKRATKKKTEPAPAAGDETGSGQEEK